MEQKMNWNLAELNIAKLMYEPEGPEMQNFNDALDSVNALGEASAGFVWRLISDGENPPNRCRGAGKTGSFA